MYILLRTDRVWEIEGRFGASSFFNTLPVICLPSDILVIGSYDVGLEASQWLATNEIRLSDREKPFHDNFDLNKDEYPNGRAYALHPTQTCLRELSSLSELKGGGRDRDLFFDHVLMYRPGVPTVPLLNYHDAMRGDLHLSGLYSGHTASSFAKHLQAVATLLVNPEFASGKVRAD